MAIPWIPRETSFDDMLEAMSARLPKAASALAGSSEPPDPGEAGEAVGRMVERLDKTFLTPFDREDLYRLADALARAEGAISEAVPRVVGPDAAREGAGVGAAIAAIGEAAGRLDEAVRALRALNDRGDALREALREVDRRSSEAGRALRAADDAIGPDRDGLAAILRRRDIGAALARALEALRDAGRAATVIVVKGA